MNARARITGWIVLSLGVWTQPVGALPINGRVVDYAARPVAGAEVAVYEQVYRAGEDYPRMGGPIVRTDAHGSFALEADLSSQYGTFVVARKEGLALGWDCLNYGSSTKGQGRFLLVLERPMELTGLVVDPAGKPVAGAQVQAVPKTSYHSRLRQRPIIAPAEWFTTRTDADGRFRFRAFCADVSTDFHVKAAGGAATHKFTTHYLSACGFEVGRTDIRLVLPQEGPVKDQVSDRLRELFGPLVFQEGQVKGQVTDRHSGKPVPNVPLVIRDNREQREDIANLYVPARAISDANGGFVFAGVPEGRHAVEILAPEGQSTEWAAPATTVEVHPLGVVDNLQIAVTRTGAIQVTAVGEYSNAPLRHLYTNASDNENSVWVSGSTDAAGVARLCVPAGSYEVSVQGDGFQMWHAAQPVTVAAGQTVSINARLIPTDRATGAVRDREGKPVAGVFAKLHPFGDEGYTDAAGGFTLGCDERSNVEGAWIIALDERQGRSAVGQVTAKDKPVDLVLEPAVRVIGRVTDPNGAPIPAARVALIVCTANCLSDLGPETLTDPNGRFNFIVVPPVAEVFEYRICVHATDYGPKLYDKIGVSGKPGDTCDLGAVPLLRADTSLSGVVVDCDGLPAPRIPIFLHGRERIDQPDKTTATNEQGQFRITRICKGPIRLQANFDSSPGGSSSADAEGGQQDIRIVLPGHLSVYASLVGKPLPEPGGVVSALPPETKDKMLLLCFFDMDQRPSRHCLTALGKQVSQLRQQGISVIGVQAGKADEATLTRWAGEQHLDVPLVTIKGELAKARLAWGVRSLPWLILTDGRHIVRAEGFAVGELDRQIETLGKTSGGTTPVPATENGASTNQRTATCLIKDPQGRVLANDRVAISPTTMESPTDAAGKLSIHYAPPADPRGLLTYLRHTDPDLIGAVWLPPAGGEVEVNMLPAVSVRGRVLDPNGQPCANVQIAALPMSSQFVLTDAAGDFDIAWAREWEPGENLCLMARRAESNWAALVDIDRETKTIEIKLEPALTLAGVIEDEDAKPIPGARVDLSLKKSWRCFMPVEPVTTDAAGRYVFPALPRNQEYVFFSRATDYWEHGISTGLIYGKQEVMNPGRIVLKKPIMSISGVVIDGNGKPVASIEVGTKGDDQPDCRTRTDAEGRFTLQGMCSGHAEVWAKLDRLLYGTVETQAGRRDVKISVSPIR